MIRVFLLDDHPAMRVGLRHLFLAEPEIEISGELGQAQGSVEAIIQSNTDVAVVDLKLPDGSGMEVISALRELGFEGGILVLSSWSEELCAPEALRNGANGYLMKEEAHEEAIGAIMAVASGQFFLTPAGNQAALASLSTNSTRKGMVIKDLYPYIVGGLLHDIKNTLMATRERVTRAESSVGKQTGLEKTKSCLASLNVNTKILDDAVKVLHELSQEHYAGARLGSHSTCERLREVARLFENDSGSKIGIEVSEEINSTLVPVGVMVFTTREMLRNSAKATRGQTDGWISVSVRKIEDKGVTISCSDNGPGFPEHVVEAAEDGGFGKSGNGRIAGGRGLYFINEVAKRLGGHLEIGNLESSGAMVEVWLPEKVEEI